MFANWPPLGLFQAQTFGGVYSDELLIHAAPRSQGYRRARSRSAHRILNWCFTSGFPVRPSATVAHASGVRQRFDCIVAALDLLEVECVAEPAESRWGMRRACSNLRDQRGERR